MSNEYYEIIFKEVNFFYIKLSQNSKYYRRERFALNSLSIKYQLLLRIIFLLILTIAGISFINNYQVNSLLEDTITTKLKSDSMLGYNLLDTKYPGDFAVVDGKLYKGDILLNETTEFVDEIKNTTGSLATIFLDDTRIATNIIQADGRRAVGTKASPEVTNLVLREG